MTTEITIGTEKQISHAKKLSAAPSKANHIAQRIAETRAHVIAADVPQSKKDAAIEALDLLPTVAAFWIEVMAPNYVGEIIGEAIEGESAGIASLGHVVCDLRTAIAKHHAH